MGKSLLITRPENDDTTYYLSQWSTEIIKEAKQKGIEVIDLYRDKANRKRVIGILEKKSPGLVFLNGHGGEDFVAGHDNEIILKDSDERALPSKIICARACKSAKVLGEKSISCGAVSYLGYKEDFVFWHDPTSISNPLKDKTAELFLEPSNHLILSLLKGHSTGDADKKAKNLFRKNIRELLIKGPSVEEYYFVRSLYWDMIHQVCLGSEDATF
jgi:hypothetical protein